MRIAITGGICSGKSSICKIIKDSGYFVFNSDDEAKILANTNLKIKEKVISLFGTDSYVNGNYNTSYIRNIVFNDKHKLEELNKCFQGLILNEYDNKSLNYEISFFESALIFEHNLQDKFNVIIGVYCNEVETIKRLKKRNGFNNNEIHKIINNQLNTKDKMNKCNIVINTTNGIDYAKLDLILNNFEKVEERGQKIFNYGLFSNNLD